MGSKADSCDRFKRISDYCNEHVGEVLTRIDFEVDFNDISGNLLLVYRSALKRCGYLEYVGKNKYKVLKKIPKGVNYHDIYSKDR